MDTRANPPRAIWVHPCEDEQFLGEHPDLKSDLDAPPTYDAATRDHAVDSGGKPGSSTRAEPTDIPAPDTHTEHKRGVFGRLKDKAIGTREEREEQKRLRAEQTAQAQEQASRARRRQLEEREAYMRAYGGYAPYHPSSAARPGYDNTSLGMDNTAALLLGGLAGGLLLGDIFSGGF